MTAKQVSVWVLVLAMIYTMGTHYLLRPEAVAPDDAAAQRREIIIRNYLQIKEAETVSFEMMDRYLVATLEEREEVHPTVREATALIYGLQREDLRERTQKVIAGFGEDYDARTLNYALGYGDEPAPNWQEAMARDWVGARIAALIYQRQERQEDYAATLIKLRHYETQIRRMAPLYTALHFLLVLGMALMVSMMISHRHWRRAGKTYFMLTPLFVPQHIILRFCGLFLIGFVAVGFLVQLILGEEITWAASLMAFYLQVGWAVYLLRYLVFREHFNEIAKVLGFHDLQMKVSNLFRILGGLAILTACYQMSEMFSELVRWPFDDDGQLDVYRSIVSNPLHSGLFILTACVAAPIFEEIIFRGLIFRSLLGMTRPWIAVTLSALLFAIVHPISMWPGAFAMGCGLALVFYRNGNLLVIIWTHALWNGLIFFMTHLKLTG